MIKLKFANDPDTKKYILALFNKSVDEEGFIIENGTDKRILSSDGYEISLIEFGGITNGSEIYIKDNIVSLIDFYRKHSGRGV